MVVPRLGITNLCLSKAFLVCAEHFTNWALLVCIMLRFGIKPNREREFRLAHIRLHHHVDSWAFFLADRDYFMPKGLYCSSLVCNLPHTFSGVV